MILLDVLSASVIDMVFCLQTRPLQFIAIAISRVRLYFHFLETDIRIQAPKKCGEIFENDDINQFAGRWATIYDGFQIGKTNWMMNWANFFGGGTPIHVRDDTLSEIYAYPGYSSRITHAFARVYI